MDTEIGEDLAAKADLAQDALVAIGLAHLGLAMEEDAVGLDSTVDVEPTAGVVQINERSTAGLGDLPE